MTKIINILQKIEEYIIVLCLTVMGIVLFLQILMRFFFSSPLSWVEELARYLQIWITFLGIGYGIRKGSHISMSLVKNKMPEIVKYIFEMVCNITSLFVFIILIASSINFITYQNVLSTAMEIPMKLVYSVIPIGATIYIIYSISDIIKLTKEQFIMRKK